MAEFVRLDPPPTGCRAYGSGTCCHDRHFDPSEIFPEKAGQTLCGLTRESLADYLAKTDNPKSVNCKDCLELIHG